MNILFWNMQGKNLDECLIEMITENNCDLIILAEYPYPVNQLCNRLNLYVKGNYVGIPVFNDCKRITSLIKNKYKTENLVSQSRYQIIKIQTSYYQLLVAMIHNISKLYSTSEEQKENLRQLHYDLLQEEKKHKTRNVLIVGDLNVNPFEEACIAANTIHGIPYRNELNRNGRKIQGRIYREFYNPMWKFLGARNAPFGTCFYDRSSMVNYFWNIFDQFLVRPELVEALDEDSLTIITKTSTRNLLNENARPNNRLYSDHLPIFVRIKEENIK